MRRRRVNRTSIHSVLSDALAIHEPLLQELLLQAAGVQVPPSPDDRAGDDDLFPALDDLIVADGVAVVPIHGLMVKRSVVFHGWFSSRLYVGTEYLAELIRDLTMRADVDHIVLDCDSGGGQVAGTEILGDAIWAARQAGKNTIAVVNEMCGSACLWAATQCERITVPASGTIGSLGAYMLHFDDTKFLKDKIGVEKTVIHKGQYKGIGERELSPDLKADVQRFVDAKYSIFVDAVARGRGLTPEEVTTMWGDSRMYSGSEAVSNGLADEIGTLQDVLDSLRAGRGGRVSIDVPPAEDPEDGDPQAMKLNAQGQVLDAAGKVVGNLADLQLDAAAVTKHFATQTSELIDSAVAAAKAAADETSKTALAEAKKAADEKLQALVAAVGPEKGVTAYLAGDTVEKAKGALADDLAAQLKAKDEEIAKLKEAAASGSGAPRFRASDDDPNEVRKPTEKADDKDAPYAAAWDANTDNCKDKFPTLQAYAAFKRYSERRAARV